jgi:hypothetical protein
MCTRLKPTEAAYRLKSTPHSAAPKVLDRPGRPWLYSEFVSPKMSGGTGSEAEACDRIALYSATWASTDRLVTAWFISVPWRVTPGDAAPLM